MSIDCCTSNKETREVRCGVSMHSLERKRSKLELDATGLSSRVVSASDCGVGGPRFESHYERLFYRDRYCDVQPWAWVVQLYCSL